MKVVVRLFFRTLRAILGPVLLLGDRLTRPKGVVRSPEAQRVVDERVRSLALYQFPTCPFCIKTRRVLHRLSLNMELRDARGNATHRATLLEGGGKAQVPCLRIANPDGSVTWLYESDAIAAWLNHEFGA